MSVLLNNSPGKLLFKRPVFNFSASRILKKSMLFSAIIMIFCQNAFAQPSTLTCNVPEQMNLGTHASMSQTHTIPIVVVVLLHGVEDAPNVISASTTDFARMRSILGSSEFVAVKDGAAGAAGYSAGSFAGFEIETSGLLTLSALSNITIRTSLAGVPVQTKTLDASLVSASLLSTGTRGTVGFVTNAAFDEVRITTSSLLALGDILVYNAVFEKYCAGPSLSCNTPTILTTPTYPVTINNANTGSSGITVGTISNTENLIDATTTNFASMSMTLGVAGSQYISVVDNVTTYAAGTFAGFDIESSSLLTVGVLSNITIKTFNNGIPTGDAISGASLVSAGSSILAGSGRQIVGFKTNYIFDEVQLIAENTLGLSLGSISVYGLILENFCTAPLPVCNTITAITNPVYPVYVNGANTGIDAITCPLCTINNSQNIIDNDLTNFATISMTVAVATSGSIAVANAVDEYPAHTFAGFELETNSLISAAVISNATISLYNNGTLTETGSGNALLVGVTSSLLSTTTRQIAGIVSNAIFDEVKISFNQLVGADLGTIKIYNAVIENSCAATIFCNRSYYLNSPNFPVVIDAQNSGVSGLVSVLATVRDPWNVVSASTTDFARISTTASVGTLASIAVLDPLSTYPSGTFAGFVINTSTAPAVLLNLFNAITISTYNNGVLQEFKSAGSLVDLTVLATLIGSPGGATYKPGFITTLPFDEIKISVTSLVGAGLLGADYVDVYGAFIDTRTSATSGSVICMKTAPDINASFLGTPAVGSVFTNDNFPVGATYGTPIAMLTNPTTTIPVMDASGSYTFTPGSVGVYHFNIPVCVPAGVTPCPTEMLTITILNNTVGFLNPPVVNTDIAATMYNTPVAINALFNDAIGTPGSRLDTASVTFTDLNGVGVSGNSVRAGNGVANFVSGVITYTPATGFIGTDTLRYTVCDNQTIAMCGSAYIVITVLGPGVDNATSAADDYKQMVQGSAISGNVRNNDIDPEGNNMTVTAKTVTVPGSYTFVLNTDGSYTFTPSATFIGPASITYQVCDDGVPSACANATAYLLVSPLAFDLPVTLLNFTVQLENCISKISWKTASEANLQRYSLEYSSNATQWNEIKNMAPKGNNSSYGFMHSAQNGDGFYRLKMIENGNHSSNSEVAKIKNNCNGKAELMIYPVPASNEINILISEDMGYNSFSISDLLGKIILKGTIYSGENKIDLSSIQQGVYSLQIVGENEVITKQISVLK